MNDPLELLADELADLEAMLVVCVAVGVPMFLAGLLCSVGSRLAG